MSADVHTLAGAYALNALPDEERQFFERHLAACAACRAEVSELQETAAQLGMASAQVPPTAVRDRVLAAIDVTRQLPPAAPHIQDARRKPSPRWLAPVAACLVLAVVALSVTVAVLDRRLRGVEGDPAAIAAVLGAEDLQTAVLDMGAAPAGRFLYSPQLDRGVLVAHGMPDPGEEQTYELWTVHNGTPVPAGLFRPDRSGTAVTVIEGTVRGAEVIAVTVEPAGGSPAPTGDILASAAL